VFARTKYEPAEYARVVRGLARTPTPEQRLAFVNGAPIPFEPGQFECDSCNAVIKAGDPAVAVTVWLEGRQEPPAWEPDYLAPPVTSIPDEER
jgi:hypothetical protein